jgi:predicted nucleic acid-binding protein
VVARAALADTSWFIGDETHRAVASPPAEMAVSMVTVAELRLGVLAAADPAARALRLSTLLEAEALSPIPIDRSVAEAWARLMLSLRSMGRRMPVNDSGIAATALAHGLPVVTQDGDYDGVPGLAVIRL